MAECIPLVFDIFQLSEEEKMAKLFCHAAREYFDGVNGKVFAVPSLRKGRDMDIVVWMHFENYKCTMNTGYILNPDQNDKKDYNRRVSREIWFNSAMLVLELKKHNTQDSLSIRNGKLYVKYENGFKNASDQNFEQVFHLQNFIHERLTIQKSKVPKIQNLIWLYRCIDKPMNSGDMDLDNVIYGEINFRELLDQLCRLNSPVSFDDGNNIAYSACKPDIVGLLDEYFYELQKEKANGLGLISRKKLDIILKAEINIEKIQKFREIGTKITVIKGNPGTGKTIHLVHLAYHLKNEEYKPVILTYNNALVQDINRMIHYSGYTGSIEIKTIHSFFYGILYATGLISKEYNDRIDYKTELRDLSDFFGNEENTAIRKASNIKYDTVLIDEAQDCDELEKDLFLKIFGQQNIVISLGTRQIVREHEISWTENISRKDINIISLNVSHRNKKDLVDFFNGFSARHFELSPWNLKENRHLPGGKMNVLLSSSYTKSFHSRLVKELIAKENSMYDLMFLSPSETKKVNYAGEICEKLEGWDFKAFNATLHKNKQESFFPIDEHRILNYQSCRGLEAWVLVCWNLDVIIRNIKTYFIRPGLSEVEDITMHVNNWLLMMFTRAIDTLILTFEDFESEEARMIIDLAQSEYFGYMSEVNKD